MSASASPSFTPTHLYVYLPFSIVLSILISSLSPFLHCPLHSPSLISSLSYYLLLSSQGSKDGVLGNALELAKRR